MEYTCLYRMLYYCQFIYCQLESGFLSDSEDIKTKEIRKEITAVSKVYVKLLKKSILIPVLLLILFVVFILYREYNNTSGRNSAGIRADILIINRDMGSTVTTGLIKYLSRYSELVISNSDISYLDYLSSIQYDYVVDIPEDYQRHFMEGRNPSVNIAGTGNVEYLPLKDLLNGYLAAAGKILTANKEISPVDLVQELDRALGNETSVILEKEDLRYQNNLFLSRYLKDAAYLLIFIMFFVIGRISSYYGEPGVRKRHDLAPLSSLNNNFKLLKDNTLFVVVCNLIIFLIMFLIKPDIILEWNLAIYFINFLIYSLCILGICYIITALAFRYEINVILIILLTAFIALLNGDFGADITNMKDMAVFSAEFTPVYWLSKVNYTVNDFLVSDWKSIKNITAMLGMNALLAAAYFSIALVINKNKSERV